MAEHLDVAMVMEGKKLSNKQKRGHTNTCMYMYSILLAPRTRWLTGKGVGSQPSGGGVVMNKRDDSGGVVLL